MNGKYYTLSWSDTPSLAGGSLVADENVVHIGQKPNCELLLPHTGEYAPELLAIIKPTRSGDGWLLIPVSDNVGTFVNGSPVGLVHFMNPGDRISFGEEDVELLFEERKEEKKGVGKEALPKWAWFTMAGIMAAVVFLALFGLFSSRIEERRRTLLIESVQNSVVQIRVDSVFLIRASNQGREVIRRYPDVGVSPMAETGTAFLTDKGLLVTARHCVEPWLNCKEILSSAENASTLPGYIAMAMEAETYNNLHEGEDTLLVVSLCRVQFPDTSESFLSTDFVYDYSRDELLELGDYKHVYYWRSIVGRFGRSDMMLGDIAVLQRPAGLKGTITLASSAQLANWLVLSAPVSILGFPNRQQSGLEYSDGRINKTFVEGEMISLGSSLSRGYSGGPVLMLKEGKTYAIGVVSTYDKGGNDCVYSVPVTELPSGLKP